MKPGYALAEDFGCHKINIRVAKLKEIIWNHKERTFVCKNTVEKKLGGGMVMLLRGKKKYKKWRHERKKQSSVGEVQTQS